MTTEPTISFPLRNIAAKWIRLGIRKFSVRALIHESLPGVLIQPITLDPDTPPINVIVLDDSTDVLLTFETEESALALCKAVMLAVTHDPPRPVGTYGLTSGTDPQAEAIIRLIEQATMLARVAGTLTNNEIAGMQANAAAHEAENLAIRAVLRAFNSLPPGDGLG